MAENRALAPGGQQNLGAPPSAWERESEENPFVGREQKMRWKENGVFINLDINGLERDIHWTRFGMKCATRGQFSQAAGDCKVRFQ